MGWESDKLDAVTLLTLGPTGTCHERAAIEYMAFQGVEDYEVEFVNDFFVGLERIRERENAFLVQCSAHPKVHEVTERHWSKVFVVDTFDFVGGGDYALDGGGGVGGRDGFAIDEGRSAVGCRALGGGRGRFATRSPGDVRGPGRVIGGARGRRG